LRLDSKNKHLFIESWFELFKVIVLLRTPYRQHLFHRNEIGMKNTSIAMDLNHLIFFLERAANHHIKQVTCLESVLALQSMVIKRGYFVKVNIGVKGHGADFEAHAWVAQDHAGEVINEFSELTPVNEYRK